jgi:hypothetical protein
MQGSQCTRPKSIFKDYFQGLLEPPDTVARGQQ